ncbi:hypothetical protein BC833DRAFT_546709 [Globomyces pollinis-pini]|nr:hypothetical protein BC833DRAFT_546709 [Globomyces pollinis-pini]
MASNGQLSLWENFIESIAQVMSLMLTDEDTEKVLTSFTVLQSKLRQLSVDNLNKMAIDPSVPILCKHKGTCKQNCGKSILRSFIVTYTLKYALGLVPNLINGKVFKDPSLLKKLGGRDTTSFALFMSTFISSYKGILCFLRYARSKNDPWNSFIAGSLSGISILLDSNKSRRVMIALYLSTRTLHFIFRWFWRHKLYKIFEPFKKRNAIIEEDIKEIKAVPPIRQERISTLVRQQMGSSQTIPTKKSESVGGFEELEDVDDKQHTHHPWRIRLRHALGTLTMMFASSQILHAYICESDTLNKSYLSFLITHGGIRDMMGRDARTYLDLIGATFNVSKTHETSKFILNSSKHLTDRIPKGYDVGRMLPFEKTITNHPQEFILCALQHPNHATCIGGASHAFKLEWMRALKLYGPLNIVMAVAFGGKRLLKDPKKSLLYLILSTIRSCLFLTCYVTAAWAMTCLFRKLRGRDEPWMYYVNGLVAGSMVMIEQPKRRLELGLYCLPRAIESLWNTFVAQGYVKHLRYGESIYFSLATGVLMTLYQCDPGSIHEGYFYLEDLCCSYRKFLYRCFGVN